MFVMCSNFDTLMRLNSPVTEGAHMIAVEGHAISIHVKQNKVLTGIELFINIYKEIRYSIKH